MRAVVQRVLEARVVVVGPDGLAPDGLAGESGGAVPRPTARRLGPSREVGRIGAGLLVLVGIIEDDGEEDLGWMERKLRTLRVFPDNAGKMSRSLTDIGGELLLISQFTLAADIGKGARPSFMAAMKPDRAQAVFDSLLLLLRQPARDGSRIGLVETGQFRAHMRVDLRNDGPVTLWLDSRLALRGRPQARISDEKK